MRNLRYNYDVASDSIQIISDEPESSPTQPSSDVPEPAPSTQPCSDNPSEPTQTSEETGQNADAPNLSQTKRYSSWIKIILLSTIVVLIAVFFYSRFQKTISHLSITSDIVSPLKIQVAGQSLALGTIDRLLLNHRRADEVTGIVLAGGSGVGKSLTANVFRNSWQWQQNVQSINVVGSDFSQYKIISEQAYGQLINDGRNLIVFDDMQHASDIIKLHLSLLLQLTSSLVLSYCM